MRGHPPCNLTSQFTSSQMTLPAFFFARPSWMSFAASSSETLTCSPSHILDSDHARVDLILAEEDDDTECRACRRSWIFVLELLLLGVELGADALRRAASVASSMAGSRSSVIGRISTSAGAVGQSGRSAYPARPEHRTGGSGRWKCRRPAAACRCNTPRGCHTGRRSRRSRSPDGRAASVS